MKTFALIAALAASLVNATETPSGEQPAVTPADDNSDLMGVGCSYAYYSFSGYNLRNLCDNAYCGTGYSNFNDCECESGTCSYYGKCTGRNYYYDFYNACEGTTIFGS